jgi:hypothetical protein
MRRVGFVVVVGLLALNLEIAAQPTLQTCGSVMGDGYVGLSFPSTCTRCEAGTYAIAGDSSCTACPENSFSESGSGSCQCNYGYSQGGIGKTLSCTLCSSNQVVFNNTCPSGYTYYVSTGSCYKSFLQVGTGSTKSWSDANAACNSDGQGYLVTINSLTENDLILSLCGGSSYDCWIGYNDMLAEGSFSWLHGTSTYSNWNNHEPNNSWNRLAENCAMFFSDYNNNGWNDGPCYLLSSRFICEADPITTCACPQGKPSM